MTEPKYRQASTNDVGQILELIKELAKYEREIDSVLMTEEQLLRDGFGLKPLFEVLVAEEDGYIHGLAIYYPRYSTWTGPSLYLEDLIVREESRGQGIGRGLMERLIQKANEHGYVRMEWQVLDWNESAIKFYQGLNVEMDNTWLNCRINLK